MDLGIVSVWLFVAVAVATHSWRCREREAMGRQTLRLLIEKTRRLMRRSWRNV